MAETYTRDDVNELYEAIGARLHEIEDLELFVGLDGRDIWPKEEDDLCNALINYAMKLRDAGRFGYRLRTSTMKPTDGEIDEWFERWDYLLEKGE